MQSVPESVNNSFSIRVGDRYIFFVEPSDVFSEGFSDSLSYGVQVLGIPFRFPATCELLDEGIRQLSKGAD